MSRLKLPHLVRHRELVPRQRDHEPVGPRDGKVRVLEHHHDRLLDLRRAASFFLVRTPREFDATGELVPCTPEVCRRWVEAALAYATAVDDISAELAATRRRAAAVPWWNHFAARRALGDWEEVRQRYEQVMREAGEAYEPVGREIRQAIQAEREKVAERAREVARREATAWRRRTELAERPVWGWSLVTEPGWRAAYVFRHDVPGDPPVEVSPQESPHVDLAGLRQALVEVDLPNVLWDEAALAETERELEGVDFGRWWRHLFYEDYRSFTARSSPGGTSGGGSSSSGGSNPSGGTSTGGTGGFSCGGFSCVSTF